MTLMPLFAVVAFSLIATTTTQDQHLTAAEARGRIGTRVTVCDMVASTIYLPLGQNRPTYLHLASPYPYVTFAVVLSGEHRDALPVPPEAAYAGKRICAYWQRYR